MKVGGGVAVLSLLGPRYWLPRAKLRGGSSACCAHNAWLVLVGVCGVLGAVC
jgi:hypothetical protein